MFSLSFLYPSNFVYYFPTLRKLSVVLLSPVMLVHNTHGVKCFKYLIAISAMLMLMPIFLLYYLQCVPMAVKLVIRLESESVLFIGQGATSGEVLGAAASTHVLYIGLYSCLVSSLGADPFS